MACISAVLHGPPEHGPVGPCKTAAYYNWPMINISSRWTHGDWTDMKGKKRQAPKMQCRDFLEPKELRERMKIRDPSFTCIFAEKAIRRLVFATLAHRYPESTGHCDMNSIILRSSTPHKKVGQIEALCHGITKFGWQAPSYNVDNR